MAASLFLSVSRGVACGVLKLGGNLALSAAQRADGEHPMQHLISTSSGTWGAIRRALTWIRGMFARRTAEFTTHYQHPCYDVE